MKLDKNTVIGFVLLGILFFVFFWYTNKQQHAAMEFQKHQQDSIARVNASKIKPVDTMQARIDSLRSDSLARINQAGTFQNAGIGTEQLSVVENSLMKIYFSNKGGQLVKVELKKFKSNDSSQVLLGGNNATLGYTINTAPNQSAETSGLFFTQQPITKNADGTQTVTYELTSANGQSITHQYIIRPDDYMIDWNVILNGADKLLTQNMMNIHWNLIMNQEQATASYEKEQSRLCYFTDDYDYTRAANGATEDFKTSVSWIAFKQQFFNTTLLSKAKFKDGKAEMKALPDSTGKLYEASANMQQQITPSATATTSFQLYYGPNDYNILKKYNNGMSNIVDLGSGIYSFTKWINLWIIMPVFTFLAKFISNYGWVIALLTLFIRLVTSPLTYKSYVSGAKMKVLRPELDELKKKFGSDQQGFAMEQMKLFREAGVNPLGGCIPALLQIPIFFALYSFFGSNILLRGQDFLWAKDLSTYDVIAKLPFTIPAYGDHVSLFTLTAVATSFLISIYNMSMTPDQSNPAMKYMPYIFPFVLLFVFNRLPAALTWYYTVSNFITLIIQFVIQNYIIDHNKILAQIDAKRKAPKTKSKFQERYQQMLEAQKKMQDVKQKPQKKK